MVMEICQEETPMTRDKVRAAARRVTQWHERFADLFGRKELQGHSLVYLKGLISQQKRKSVEPIALQFGRGLNGVAATQNEVVALQGFLTQSPWEASDVFQEIQAVFAEAIDLIDYYRKRNDVAHKSHRKTWLAKHKRLAEELLLWSY